MRAWQFATLLDVSEANGWTRLSTLQDELDLLHREKEREILPLCAAEDICEISWHLLARGRPTRDWDKTA